MKKCKFILAFCILLSFSAFGKFKIDELDSKTEKYLQILLGKPQPGYLFDRFYGSWLENNSSRDLELYLEENAKESVSHRMLLAFYYEKIGKDAKALSAIKMALKSQPGSPKILLQKAQLEMYTLNIKEAILDLEKALTQDAGDTLKLKIMKLLGTLQLREQDKVSAIKTWETMVRDYPEFEVKEDLLELLNSDSKCNELCSFSDVI